MEHLRITGDKRREHVRKVGSAIAGALFYDDKVMLSVMGASAVNVAIKGVVIAQDLLQGTYPDCKLTVQPDMVRKSEYTVIQMLCRRGD